MLNFLSFSFFRAWTQGQVSRLSASGTRTVLSSVSDSTNEALLLWRYCFDVDGARRGAFEKGAPAHKTEAGTPSFGRLSPSGHHIPIPAVPPLHIAGATLWH